MADIGNDKFIDILFPPHNTNINKSSLQIHGCYNYIRWFILLSKTKYHKMIYVNHQSLSFTNFISTIFFFIILCLLSRNQCILLEIHFFFLDDYVFSNSSGKP